MSDNGKHEPDPGHPHGPGCGHDHSHDHHHHHAPQSPEELAAAAAVSRILSAAGYDVTNGETFKRGAAALMAAQMVAVSAGLAGKVGAGVSPDGEKVGRNDPCPCGSGKKYKKCCLDKEPAATAANPVVDEFGGVRPKMIPQMDLDSMQTDTATLGALFQRDPALRKCRFDAARMANYLEPHAGHVPTHLQERDRWIALRAHGFVTGEHERDGDQGDTLLVLRGLKEALLSAAGRCPRDDEALRALALGLLYHSSWAPGLEAPHPLETLLFRLTLQETAVEQQTRASLVLTLGDDPDELARRIAAGDPEAAAQWQASFDELPEERRMELLQAAERYHDRVLETIVAGTFPVPLPLASVLPLVIETVKVARDAGDEEAAKEAARQLAVRRAREGLNDGDRALYVELCDGWLASGEADSDEQADQVRYARGLASVGASSLEAVLLLAFLDHHRVTPIPEEPSPDPAGGLEIDSPDFLERYGAFLAELGHSELAVRTWRLCRFAGPIPDAIRDRITEAEAAIADRN